MKASERKSPGSSKLLIQEEPLQVLPGLAVALGLNEAIILQQLHYWLLRKSKTRDGREWYYNTYEQWKEQFPFWSVSTIKRAVHNLEKNGVITTSNYNHSPIDKTKWYAINYDKLNELGDLPTAQNEPSTIHNDSSTAQNEPSTDQNELSTCQVDTTTGQVDTLHGSFCTDQYPETISETKDRDLNPSPSSPPQEHQAPLEVPTQSPEGECVATEQSTQDTEGEIPSKPARVEDNPTYSKGFKEFWRLYPKKQNPGKAWQAWKNQKCERLTPIITASVQAHCADYDWTKEGGRYIPYPATFLNGKRWEDELTPASTDANGMPTWPWLEELKANGQ